MDKLDAYRTEINKLDNKIIPLLKQRLRTVEAVGQYKKEQKMQVMQKSREDEIYAKIKFLVDDEDEAKSIGRVYRLILSESRAKQIRETGDNKKSSDSTEMEIIPDTVGYQGVPGSFSEEALFAFFGEGTAARNYESFFDVVSAVQTGEISHGILPLENSTSGGVSQVYDLLREGGVNIIGELLLPVSQHLLVLPGTKLSDIKEVYSHPQALNQSAAFLRQHPSWLQVPYYNTAMSASYICEQKDLGKAAIASERAAKLYGLEILGENINDAVENTTKFIVISKTFGIVEDADKISIFFTVRHEAGALGEILDVFSENGLNMLKIESRSIPETPFVYAFFIDFEGSLADPLCSAAIGQIEEKSEKFSLLGNYKKAPL